jgi:hypothetical protein
LATDLALLAEKVASLNWIDAPLKSEYVRLRRVSALPSMWV